MKRSSDQSSEWWEQKTRTLRGGPPLQATVFLRSLAPPVETHRQQQRTLETIQTLERQGAFDTVTVNVWGKSISPDSAVVETEPGKRALEYIDDFTAWTARTDVDVTLPFEEQAVSCTMTDDHYDRIVLPRLCLAVYADEKVELLLPCEIDGDSYSVGQFLDAVDNRTPVEQGIGTSA